MDYNPSTCELFINQCDKNETLSADQLFKAIIGVDANGCPVVKVNVIEEKTSIGLTNDFVQANTMANLKTATNTWIASHPSASVVNQSTFWDGTNYTTNFFYK